MSWRCRDCLLVLCLCVELGRCGLDADYYSGCEDDGRNQLGDGCGGMSQFYRHARIILQDITVGSAVAQDGGPPITRGARDVDIMELKSLMSTSEDLDVVDDQNKTPLWHATSQDNLQMVKYLLEEGANPNIKSVDGTTPLYIACGIGSLELVKVLVNYEADIEAATEKGATPVLMASQAGHPDVVIFLIEAGADLNVVKSASRQSPLWSAAFFGHDQVVRVLLEAGAETDMPEVSGATPLYAASQEGHLRSVLLLYEAGADVNSPTLEKKATALHVAAASCHADVVATLLLLGGNPRSTDSSGLAAEDIACISEKKDEGKIRDLLSYSASLDKVIGLDEVLQRGIKYEPPILEWIKRLLYSRPLVTTAVKDGTANSGMTSFVNIEATGPQPKDELQDDGVGVALFTIAGITGLVLVSLICCLLLVFTKAHRGDQTSRPRSVPNPPAGSSSGAVHGSTTPNPVWKEPQIPRPTVPRRGSLDSNPVTLLNQTNEVFSKDALLEWIKEPQCFAPSNSLDLEIQTPGVAASEGSRSSAQGFTLVNGNLDRSRSFSSPGRQSSRGRRVSDQEIEGIASLLLDQARPVTLRRIDPATQISLPSQIGRSETTEQRVHTVNQEKYRTSADEPGPSTSG